MNIYHFILCAQQTIGSLVALAISICLGTLHDLLAMVVAKVSLNLTA
jgi:hypothetical protein